MWQNKASGVSLSAAAHQFPTGGAQQPRWDWPALTVHGHLIYLGGVVLLDVSQDADVIVLHKVDGYTFSAVSARPANSVEAEGKREWSHLGEG